MILIDLFVYTVYNFLTKRLHRNEDDAKFSTVLLLSAFISFFIIDSIHLLGIFKNNRISTIFIEGEALSNLIIMVPIAILVYIRYYKCVSIEKIEDRLSVIQTMHILIMKTIIMLLAISIPICFYIFYRLHKFEHV